MGRNSAPGHRYYRGDLLQRFEHCRGVYIAGVDNQLGAGQGRQRLGTHQAVRIGDDADHLSRPRTAACTFERTLCGNSFSMKVGRSTSIVMSVSVARIQPLIGTRTAAIPAISEKISLEPSHCFRNSLMCRIPENRGWSI